MAGGVDLGRGPLLIGGGLIRSAGGWSAIKALRSVDMRTMGDKRILGGGDFVQSVLTHAKEHYEKKTLAHVRGLKLQTLIETVAEKLGLVPTDVWSTGR